MFTGDIFILRSIFILLNIVNLLVFYNQGNKLATIQNEEYYWKKTKWIIISYAVVMGLRFGRMIDYNIYFTRYVTIGQNFNSLNYEFSFKAICWFFYNIGIPYQGFVCFCSIMIITSVLQLLKDYKQFIPLALFFFLWEASNVELFIRWYLAYAFFIYFFVSYQKKQHKKSIFFGVLAITTHVGIILLIILVIGVSFIQRQLLPSFIVEILFIMSLCLGTIEIFNFLIPYTNFLAFDERSAAYADQYQNIVSGTFGLVGIMTNDTFAVIRQIIAYSFPIYMIPTLLKNKIIPHCIANLFIIGVILAPILKQVEIMNRFAEGLLFFSIIVSSTSYYYIFKNRNKYSTCIYYLSLLSLFCNIWPVISGIITRNKWWQMMYIWDADGRNTLPIELFLN